jgi:hypothetical protein
MVRCIGSLGRGIGAAMARCLAPFWSRPAYTLGLDPLCVSRLFSLFLLVVVVLSTKKMGLAWSPTRKIMPREGTLPRAYKWWSYEYVDGAVHEFAERYALNAAASKSKAECKNVRQVAKAMGGASCDPGKTLRTARLL